jgi:hypothetical protein
MLSYALFSLSSKMLRSSYAKILRDKRALSPKLFNNNAPLLERYTNRYTARTRLELSWNLVSACVGKAAQFCRISSDRTAGHPSACLRSSCVLSPLEKKGAAIRSCAPWRHRRLRAARVHA